MKPRINVHLTEQIAERLAAAAKRSGASKTAIVEAALARFFDVDGEANDNGVLLRHLNSTSRQLEQLDLEVKIVSETVALHARYLLTVTPPLRHADQRAACALGLDRFEVFASQVGRRVQLGAPLMRETMARVSGSGPKAFAPDLEEDPLPSAEVADREPGLSAAPIVDEGPEFSTAAQEDGNMGFPAQGCHPSRSPIPHSKARVVETAAAPQPSATTSWAMSRQEKWRLIAFVFLPFATGYYLSYLYRTISALISTRLVSDLALQAADLGFLTSVYFLAFAAGNFRLAYCWIAMVHGESKAPCCCSRRVGPRSLGYRRYLLRSRSLASLSVSELRPR